MEKPKRKRDNDDNRKFRQDILLLMVLLLKLCGTVFLALGSWGDVTDGVLIWTDSMMVRLHTNPNDPGFGFMLDREDDCVRLLVNQLTAYNGQYAVKVIAVSPDGKDGLVRVSFPSDEAAELSWYNGHWTGCSIVSMD